MAGISQRQRIAQFREERAGAQSARGGSCSRPPRSCLAGKSRFRGYGGCPIYIQVNFCGGGKEGKRKTHIELIHLLDCAVSGVRHFTRDDFQPHFFNVGGQESCTRKNRRKKKKKKKK